MPHVDPIWVNRKHFCAMTGLPESTIRGWQNRLWTRGIHYQVIGQTTLINHAEYERWVNQHGQKASGLLTTADSGSGSLLKEEQLKLPFPVITQAKVTSKSRSLKEIE